MKQNVVILPGFSAKNADWAQEVALHLQPHFEAKILTWKHWETGDSADFSKESEVSAFITLLGELGNKHIHVIAKSIGTWILANTVQQSINSFANIVLCGVPINDLTKEELDDYAQLTALATGQVQCYQNDEDSHGSANEVSTFFENLKINIPITVKSGNTHDYPYYEDFAAFLKKEE